MAATISLTDQDVFTALRAFLVAILPANTPVVQAQDNLVPMPVSGFVAMTSKSTERLETNLDAYTDTGTNPGTRGQTVPTRYVIQIDVYGADSPQWAAIIQGLFRSSYALETFPATVRPLHADDPIQIPLINGEHNYEQRWKLDAHMQYNPVITTSQDFADTLSASLVSVERTYPA